MSRAREMDGYLEELRTPGQTVNPLFGFLGVLVGPVGGDRAEMRLPLKPEFVQGAGVVAGGVVGTLMAEAMAHAVICGLPEGASTAAAEISTRYLRPVAAPGEGEPPVLTARARVVKRGRRVVTVEAEAFVDPDKPNALSMATFMVL